MTTQV